jgi:excisionase family DNA binding protein
MTDNEKHDYILTFKEAEVYLKIPRSTLYKLLQEGRVPARKVGRHWRFVKSELDAWLRASEGGHAPSMSRQYCWQHMKTSECGEKHDCLKCIVYRAKALECYELRSETGHKATYCKDDCRSCEYYLKYFGD